MKKFFIVLIISITIFSFSETIKIWFAGTQKELMDLVNDELIPKFEKENSEIKLSVEFIPWGQLSTKLTTSFAGNMGPDIFMHGQAAIAGFAEKDILIPLDKYLKDIEDYKDFGNSIDTGLYNNSHYFIPLFGSGRLLVVREDILNENNIPNINNPLNWNDLKNIAEKVTIKTGKRITRSGLELPVQGIDLQQVWSSFLYQNGGQLFDKNADPVFNDKKGIDALNYYSSLINDVCPEYGVSSIGTIKPIAAEKSVMSFLTLEDLKDIEKYSPDKYDKLKILLPPEKEKKSTFYSFAGFMVVNNKTKIQTKIKVLNFLTSKDNIVSINKVLGTLPPRQSSLLYTEFSNDETIKKYIEGSYFSFGNPNITYWSQARDILIKHLERAIKKVETSEEALNKAYDEIIKLK
ncbi:multiple sugar transport system substrate-binding protein [Oceanotoga teriensis]|uniref:Multiple sugar transport system substrate-binding protein n=1 Tax=Oceanotoga teriensis TaxID=515440 RepID=A0AA45C700_9BACT|nr:extracellular solute-binding protein [Oceanotoga teriensis]PWJ95103.1 multiple sugar transport system substrate-binding protein [Oceanotoga teriensis]